MRSAAEDDDRTIAELRTRIAEYAMAVDLLSRLAQAVGETDVARGILDLLQELFAPATISFVPLVDGRLGEAVTVGEPISDRCRRAARDALAAGATCGDGGFVLPLARGDEVLAVVVVSGLPFPERCEHYLDVALGISEILALTVAYARAYDRLVLLSVTDELTGLPNRRSGLERLETDLARCRRQSGDLAVAILDIDLFKRVNDEYGHAVGDAILREVSHRLREAVRPYDMLARLGGEEFLVVAPDIALPEATGLAERLRRAISGEGFMVERTRLKVTISAGVTAAREDDLSPKTALARADAALYAAKSGGRDRVETA